MAPSAPTTSPEMPFKLSISLVILSVACLAWLARFLTSEATTAKPRPASPARADSIVALRASQIDLSGDIADQLDDAAHRLRRIIETQRLCIGGLDLADRGYRGSLRFRHRLRDIADRRV